MIDKNYWLNEWRNMMCQKMCIKPYKVDYEFFDYRIHCKTPDGIVRCAQCRYNNIEGDKRMEDKNYWLNEWRQMMCNKMSDIDEYNGKICCNTLDGCVTCDQCRYFYLYEEE